MSPGIAQQLELAESQLKTGNMAAAEQVLRALHTQAPAHGRVNELLGYVAGNKGEWDAALGFLQAATSGADASAQAWYFLGKLYLERAQFPEAAHAFGESLRRNGEFFEGLHDMGVALNGCGRHVDALSAYDLAQRLHPQSDTLHYNRGVALDAVRRSEEALASYERALAINPDFALAWHNRGAVLSDLARSGSSSRLEQALASFGRAVALDPEIPFLAGDWVHARMRLCDWNNDGTANTATADIDGHVATLLAALDAGKKAATPFPLLSLPLPARQLKRHIEAYAAERWPAPGGVVAAAKPRPRNAPSRIRIGYFSPDFKSHAVSFLTAGLFEQHDRSRFEIHAVALGEPHADPMTARLRQAFEHWHDAGHLNNHEITTLAQRLDLDVAVDLAGHTTGARTDIFAQRCAPLQVSYLGFPGTMGAAFIDYLIADRHVVPDASRAACTEQLVFMPTCFQVNDDKRAIAATLPRAAYGLTDDAFVFCAFSSAYKLNPTQFAAWMQILREVPRGVLWLVAEHDAQVANLKRWAEAHGIAGERLIFAGSVAYAEHLARYRAADLVLDTLPFNGGTTTSDALWAGVPVLTCSSDTYAGRMATSLLHAVGLPELIAPTLDAYRDTAVRLAGDAAALTALRHRLAANRASTPLFNTALFTRHLEQAYGKMVERHQAGLPPAHLHIAD